MTLRGEIPRMDTKASVPSPGHAPATAWDLGPVPERPQDAYGRLCIWGVEYVATKETGYMSRLNRAASYWTTSATGVMSSKLLIFLILTGKPWRKRIWSMLTEHRHP